MLRLTLHRYPAQFGLAYRNATFEVFRFRGREPGGTCLNRDDP